MYYLLAQEYLNGILLDNWMIKNPITGKNYIYEIFSLAYSDSKKYCYENNNREVRVIVVHSKTKIET
jgi:hypothetical protein